MTEELKRLEERVSLVASRMTLREPFIAAVFTKLKREFRMDGTAYTNGKAVGYGVEFCAKLTDEELLFVSMHEALHVVFMHMWRRESRNPAVFNIATDAVINKMLKDKFYAMPQGGVLLPWVTSDMDAEDVYRRLMEENPNPQQQPGQNQDGDGDGEPLPGQTGGGGFDGKGDLADAPDQSDAADMEATIMTAARMAKACGDRSAMIERILGGELAPTVPWTEVTRNLLSSHARNDFSYRRFNRRMIGRGIYMPSLYSEAMGGLVVGVDTSGSIGPNELDQIAGEITAIAQDCNPDWVEVVYCDTRVGGTERFEQAASQGGRRYAVQARV